MKLVVAALVLLVLWQEVRIQLLTKMHPQHGELMLELERLADDVDWVVSQIPRHNGMRSSYFER